MSNHNHFFFWLVNMYLVGGYVVIGTTVGSHHDGPAKQATAV